MGLKTPLLILKGIDAKVDQIEGNQNQDFDLFLFPFNNSESLPLELGTYVLLIQKF